MERVKKVEKYWYLRGNLEVAPAEETDSIFDISAYLNLNYFHTKKEAESVLKKLRAVLKGADVIEMPTDEEIDTESKKYEYPPLFKAAINFLKSKIVK